MPIKVKCFNGLGSLRWMISGERIFIRGFEVVEVPFAELIDPDIKPGLKWNKCNFDLTSL